MSRRLALLGLTVLLLSTVAWRPGIKSGWRWARISDTHINWVTNGLPAVGDPLSSVPLMALADTLNSLGVDFLIISGDLAWDCIDTAGTYYKADRPAGDSLAAFEARLNCPIYMCLGNHEADADDTLSTHNPYQSFKTAYQRYLPTALGDLNWWKLDHKGKRFIFVQNNCEYGDTCPEPEYGNRCYPVNNPSYGHIPYWDYDGITDPASAQRESLAVWTSLADRSGRRLVIIGHRHIYGSNSAAQNARPNLNQGTDSGPNGKGFVKAIEDSLGTAERAIYLGGDQHIAVWDNYAIADSARAASGAKGIYHMMCDWGNSRTADSTEAGTNTATLQSARWFDGDEATRIWRDETGAWSTPPDYVWPPMVDNVLDDDDPGVEHLFTWELYTVYGDDVLLEVFRTITTQSATWEFYPGAGTHVLLNRSRLTLDAR